MKVTLICAIVGRGGGAFSVQIDDGDLVYELKKAIKAKKSNDLKDVDVDKLRLFLAKMTDGAWLKDSDPAAQQLYRGETHSHIQQVIDGKQAKAMRALKDWFDENKMLPPSTEQIHVLVVVADDYVYIRVKDIVNDALCKDELTRYQQRGNLIQRNCRDYCQQILTKIESLYALPDEFALPFICVEGSYGMGKSQLGFALGGSRPWFYWPATLIGPDSQPLYRNFSSISDAFCQVTDKDDPIRSLKEKDVLNTRSTFYKTVSLWTFGFIRALLKHCSKEQNQQGQMIRFQEKTLMYVEKCNCEKVVTFRNKMTAEGKALPFFVLDEMMQNPSTYGRGKAKPAFQRNVFRVCGLVVVMMGTDAKINDLVVQSTGSHTEKHSWMTVISRFPPYQSIPFADDDKQIAWNHLLAKYPVLTSIVVNSRGRFAGLFVDSAAEYAVENFANDIKLYDVLDVAFYHVSSETQRIHPIIEGYQSYDVQLMAISYTNVGPDDTSLPPCKKRKIARSVGVYSAHLHFADLVDDQITEVDVMNGKLGANGEEWQPLRCFPNIKKDILLYLAVLGGKTYSGYYDHELCTNHSTSEMFLRYWRRWGSCNDTAYENMIAHMFFCASRRNGVQGISFDDFFAELLSECQYKIRPVTMTIDNTKKTIVASDILDKYVDLEALSCSKIPFLAPPNAKWPQWILDTRAEGCNFGHLVRPPNIAKCDILVCNMEDISKPLFLCECKYCDESVDFGAVNKIIGGLETVWKDKWALVMVFCEELVPFETKWNREKVGCVKIDCRSGRVDWVFQPAEENRKKLVIVMETGDFIDVV